MVTTLAPAIERSADPAGAAARIEDVIARQPEAGARLAEDPALGAALVAVTAASPWLGRVCASDPAALDVLADLDRRVDAAFLADPAAPVEGDFGAWLARWKQLEVLRLAARDLLGFDELEAVGEGLADLAEGLLVAAYNHARARVAEDGAPLAVVAMGKLGARELNYASDVDLLLVGAGDPRPLLVLARHAWRIDLDLRPEGRSGPLVRSLASYRAYWDRWADTWEFQSLLKARPVAGSAELGAAFASEAAGRVWGRPFGAEELRQVRQIKARTEGVVARRGLSDRELKLGRGGIRDIEFAVQLLQLVHGRADPSLRVPTTLAALGALADGGYVAAADAGALAGAYRFLRTAEHRLQLREDQPVHALPSDGAGRIALARVLGFRDGPSATARAAFESDLRRHQATVRSIHERLFFRPLLEAFTAVLAPGSPTAAAAAGRLPPQAVDERLAAFGFSDASRTGRAVQELTRGLTRSSRLMAQLLPLLFGWLSESPDPDLGLLGLRTLAAGAHHRQQLVAVCRESAEAARELCLLLGTGPLFMRDLQRHPDVIATLGAGSAGRRHSPEQLHERARRSLAWRSGEGAVVQGLRHFLRAEHLRIAVEDVLNPPTPQRVDRAATALSDLAETVLGAALDATAPRIPFAIIAMGRLGGRELSYASDLDVLFVYDGSDAGEGERVAASLSRLVSGETPATRLYRLDTDLRPEGRHGPLARSLDAYAAYYARWAQPWERQALLRGRVVAGNAGVGARFAQLAEAFVWGRSLEENDVRALRRTKARMEIERAPAGEDPQFHLKLGRGSLSDVEWTVQLLQLRHGVRQTSTVAALETLGRGGAIEAGDMATLMASYRFCEQARNRLYLVRDVPGDALPGTGPTLTALARSLGTTAPGLRDEYRRLTRRARRVMERLFYGRTSP